MPNNYSKRSRQPQNSLVTNAQFAGVPSGLPVECTDGKCETDATSFTFTASTKLITPAVVNVRYGQNDTFEVIAGVIEEVGDLQYEVGIADWVAEHHKQIMIWPTENPGVRSVDNGQLGFMCILIENA